MYEAEQLDAGHNTSAFESGKEPLDSWLQHYALNAAAKRVSSTFVWHDRARVVAYFTLSAHLIVRDEVPRKLGRGDPDQIPAALLARLALDKSLHGQGFGGVLLAEALGRVVAVDLAVRYVVVDAIDAEAANFYRHYGFRETPVEGRLLRKVSDIAADLQA